ncbi:MAG: hypothetical protein KQJ78_08695 [Deltaproteobacteria bacterium]|nr:hypothetical protein [Deltaproteobacteria bacterium]
MRSHLEQRGLPDERLAGPHIPPAGRQAWEWFWDLSAGRGSDGGGAAPLSYREIWAWRELTGENPRPWEIALLRTMDRVYLGFVAEANRKRS